MIYIIGLIFVVSGLILGLVYWHSFGLAQYIKAMDQDEDVCEKCMNKDTCFAHKPLGKSNIMTEFTFTSYQIVRKKCEYAMSSKRKAMLVLAVSNSILYAGLYIRYSVAIDTILYCLSTTILIYIAYVDWETQYIPFEFNLVIFVLGLVRLAFEPTAWLERIIGLGSVMLLLLIVNLIGRIITKGDDVIGGGDIKLMAAAGLLLGWKLNIVAFMMGCICGSIIHLIVMKIGKGDRKLAFGPYLALGIYIAMICGEQLMSWYLGIMGLKP